MSSHQKCKLPLLRSTGSLQSASSDQHPPRSAGRPAVARPLALLLGWGLVVALGACSGEAGRPDCTSDEDCDDDNPCTIGECLPEQICLQTAAPDGPSDRQTPADCRVELCVDGEPEEAFDPTDVFDDLNPCTDDICDPSDYSTRCVPIPFVPCEYEAGQMGQCGCIVDGVLGECPEPGTIMCQQP